MKVTSSEKLPVKLWMENFTDMESGAWNQVKNLANFPFAFRHIAIMPDAHQGYGMPIGGVMATKNVIVPNAVGVDIGCGMCVVKTSLKKIDVDILKKIMGEIRKAIPVGFKHHKEKQDESLMPKEFTNKGVYWCDGSCEPDTADTDLARSTHLTDVVYNEWDNALTQIGTLGGGNHFIEIQKGSDGYIWIMIHSGSRNLGFKVANHYNKLAVELNEKWGSAVPKSWELAFLPVDSKEGQAYIKEMRYCIDFALANRKLMMDRICKIVESACIPDYPESANIVFDKMINIAHNYAALENHFGQNVWVHRKGATKATKGLTGIIPGSQGTNSYIVEGLGNRESFMSCSHGAGRKMGRKQARENLDLKEELKKMEGIVHGIRSVKDLDEAPGSYKEIDKVMSNQSDLVKILVELTPLANMKG